MFRDVNRADLTGGKGSDNVPCKYTHQNTHCIVHEKSFLSTKYAICKCLNALNVFTLRNRNLHVRIIASNGQS